MAFQKKTKRNENRGFTILEIMVVVTIIGLIASIAIPAYSKSRQSSIVARTANDFRQFADKFQIESLSSGDWPADGLPATIPLGMEVELHDGNWGAETAIGGYWDWDYSTYGVTAAVSIDQPAVDEETMAQIDALIDDGNLSTGQLRLLSSSHFSYILAE